MLLQSRYVRATLFLTFNVEMLLPQHFNEVRAVRPETSSAVKALALLQKIVFVNPAGVVLPLLHDQKVTLAFPVGIVRRAP